MNLSQLAYNLATGQHKVDRARNQELLDRAKNYKLYAGANPGGNRPTPNQLSAPDDYRQSLERITLIKGARQMEEDYQFFDGILKDFETYVVGGLCYRANTGNPDADSLINDYLELQFNNCDVSQRLDLVKIARLAIRSMKRDGECGFITIEDNDSVKLNYLSGDRIGNPTIGANVAPNDYNGIVVNEDTGAPMLYNIYKRAPKINLYTFQKAVPANQFFHYYDPFRFEQYHGVSVFKNSIEHAFDMKQILDYTKLNIKWRASQLPYIKNELGAPRGSGYAPVVSTNGTPQPMSINVDGVTQSFLRLDEGVMDYPNDFPNTQFVALMEELKRDCAIGAGLPLEFCYRSQTGGVVQRFYANKAERTFDEEKRWMQRTLLNPYKARCIQKGIESGQLNLSKFGLDKNLARFKGSWQMGRAISVDYSKEVDADMKLIEAGVMSPQDYASENAKDLDSIRIEIKQHTLKVFQDAKEIADATGQDIALVLPFLVKKFPNPGAGLSAGGDSASEPAPKVEK